MQGLACHTLFLASPLDFKPNPVHDVRDTDHRYRADALHLPLGLVARQLTKKEISEDDRKRLEDEVQKLTDSHVAQTDEAAAKKEQEILTQ